MNIREINQEGRARPILSSSKTVYVHKLIFYNNVRIQLYPFNKHFTMLDCSNRVEGLSFGDV